MTIGALAGGLILLALGSSCWSVLRCQQRARAAVRRARSAHRRAGGADGAETIEPADTAEPTRSAEPTGSAETTRWRRSMTAWRLSPAISARLVRSGSPVARTIVGHLSSTGVPGVPVRESDQSAADVALAVALRARAGRPAPAAWADSLVHLRPDAARRISAGWSPGDAIASDAGSGPAWTALAAAARVADISGAPIADVLESLAQGLDEQEELANQRHAALAGPAASVSLLTWLPLAGLGLGFLLGVDPLVVMVDGGWGTASAVAGVALAGIGRIWTRRMVRRAANS